MFRREIAYWICLLSFVALAACSHSPPQFEGGPLEELDGSTKYHLADHDDGYEIHVFHERSVNRRRLSSLDLFFDLLSAYLGVPRRR